MSLEETSLLYAHHLFLKLDSYFLAPDTSVRITVLNGTFTSSEAALVADRITERYSKHVKAVFQVGASRSSAFATSLGYPAEIVPLQNPYSLSVGSELSVRCLVDGRPVANQAVIAGGVHQGATIEERMVRTDQYGVARITLDSPGKWYVKFVNMVEVAHDGLDYESKWATLTFEIRWVSGGAPRSAAAVLLISAD